VTGAGRPPRRTARPAGALLAAALLLAGCSPGEGAAPSPSGSAAASSAAPGSGASPSPADPSPPVVAPTGTAAPVTAVVVTASLQGAADSAWPSLLAAGLQAQGIPVSLTTATGDGAAFAPVRAGAPSFADLVEAQVPSTTQLVVLADGGEGSDDAAAAGEGAARALRAVESAAPDAQVVVVGPWRFSGPQPPAAVREAVAAAAGGADSATTRVDPVAEGWPAGAGQQEVADRLRARLAPLADALSRSGAAA